MENVLPKLKRIAAVHDISGFGKCSLTAALPVVSATGVECACMPTALFSTHTGEFTGWTFRDLTDQMLPMARHWHSIGMPIDGIYSGYLASPAQVEEMRARYLAGNYGYGHAKQALFEAYMEFFAPMRKRREELLADPGYVHSVLKAGAEKARAEAVKTMKTVRERVGLA